MPPILQKSLFFIWNKIPKDGVRHFFQWSYSGVVIPFFWGGVLALIGIASAIENSRPVFVLAYFFAFAGWVWTFGYWITCDYLHKKNPNTWERARRKRTSKRDWGVYQIWRYAVSFLISLLFVASCFFIFWIGEQKELSSHHGWIFPANEPTPENACGKLKNGQVVVILGPAAVIVDKFPFTFIKVGGQRGVIIDKGPNGSVSISLDIFSEDGKIIATIEKGNFIINSNNILRMERKDRSNLRIINQYNQEVLNMRYLNPQTLRINALLHYPGYRPLIIKESNLGDMFKSTDNDSFPWVCFRRRAIEVFKDGSILIN